jgi:hypothetical protein
VPVGGLIDYTGRRLDALTGTTNAAATAHARTTHSNSPERRTR